MSGVRIVRIATHPNAQGRGYGSRALELLLKYYQGNLVDHDNIKVDELKEMKEKVKRAKAAESGKELKDEKIKPKKALVADPLETQREASYSIKLLRNIIRCHKATILILEEK